MAIKEFTIESIAEFDDGRLARAINEELRRCVLDMENRPNDDKPRKVQVMFSLLPVRDPDDGSLEQSTLDFEVKAVMPTRKSPTYNLGTKKGGHLYFSENNPRQIDQLTVDDQIEKNQAKAGEETDPPAAA